MNFPQNGTFSANLSLVAIGAVAGAGITFSALRLGRLEVTDYQAGGSGQEESMPPARSNALAPGTGGVTSSRHSVSDALVESNPRRRGEMLREAGADAARGDIRGALDAGDRLESEKDRLEYYRGVFGEWAETDPEAALDYARSTFPPGIVQADTIGIAMNKWGAGEPREAWIWAEQNLSGPLKEQALNDLMMGWTRRSPSSAADWLAGTGLTSQPLVAIVSGTWAEQDPRAAAGWAKTLPEGDMRATAKVAVAREWGMRNPSEAADFFKIDIATAEASTSMNLATTLANIWASTNPSEATGWVNGLPEGPGKAQAAGTLATVWAARDIDGAVAWSTTISDAEMRGNVVAHIGTTWGAIEPDRAIAWLQTLPPAEAHEGITGALNSWAATDPIGMRDWLDASGTDPLADRGRRSLGDVISSNDILGAMNLALEMGDPGASNDALARYFRQWRKADDASAQTWLQETWPTLSPAAQIRLNREQAMAR